MALAKGAGEFMVLQTRTRNGWLSKARAYLTDPAIFEPNAVPGWGIKN